MKNLYPQTGAGTPNPVSKMHTKLSKFLSLNHPLRLSTFQPILRTFGTTSIQNNVENTVYRVGQKQLQFLKIGALLMFGFFATNGALTATSGVTISPFR